MINHAWTTEYSFSLNYHFISDRSSKSGLNPTIVGDELLLVWIFTFHQRLLVAGVIDSFHLEEHA